MAGDFRIRPTTPADLPALERLEGSAFSDPWSFAMLEEALAHSEQDEGTGTNGTMGPQVGPPESESVDTEK